MSAWKECDCALPAALGELRAGETKQVGDTHYHRQPKTGKVFMHGPPCGCGGDKHAAGVGGANSTTLGPRGMGDAPWKEYRGAELPVGIGRIVRGARPTFYANAYWYRQPKSGKVMVIGLGDDPSDCDATEVYNPVTQTCEKKQVIEACAPGYSWTHEHGCVKDPTPPVTPPIPPPNVLPSCAADETYNAVTGKCEKNAPPQTPSTSSSKTGWIIGGLAAAGVAAVGAALLMKPKSTQIHKAADANMREAAVYEERGRLLRTAARKRESEERARARRAA